MTEWSNIVAQVRIPPRLPLPTTPSTPPRLTNRVTISTTTPPTPQEASTTATAPAPISPPPTRGSRPAETGWWSYSVVMILKISSSLWILHTTTEWVMTEWSNIVAQVRIPPRLPLPTTPSTPPRLTNRVTISTTTPPTPQEASTTATAPAPISPPPTRGSRPAETGWWSYSVVMILKISSSLWILLQKLVSQLKIHGVSFSQEDVNQKFLRCLPSAWKTHTIIWRNKADLEEQSLDDLFNSLKIYEDEVEHSQTNTNTKRLRLKDLKVQYLQPSIEIFQHQKL
nr:ribonuclease H-like domain-containing protein [Tanacetum cinerariifolium]